MSPTLLWVFAFIGVAALLVLAHNVLILVFIAVVFAAGLRGAGLWLGGVTGLGYGKALAAICLFIAALFAGGFVLMGVEVAQQAEGFGERVQGAAESSAEWLEERPWGQFLLDQLETQNDQGASEAILGTVQGLATGLFALVTGFFVIVVLAVFFAADSRGYERGIVRYLPPPHRERLEDLFDRWATALRWWMLGQTVSMIFLAVSTFLILTLLAVPQALLVALLVGVLTFIPYLGPIIGAIPVVLVASTQGGQTLLWVLVLYVIVQNVEGSLLMPLVQRHVIHVRPAVLLSTQLLMGALFGMGGILIAAPLAAVSYATLESFERRPTVRKPARRTG